MDNMDASEGLLEEFRQWFADPGTKKVWHNYGFDRHVLYNHGVDCLVRCVRLCVCVWFKLNLLCAPIVGAST